MKVLLVGINAKYIHSNPALYSLKAYADRKGAGAVGDTKVVIAEYTINMLPKTICDAIYNEAPDVICFSCYIWNIETVSKIVSDLAVIMPSADIWLGGPEVSFGVDKEMFDYIRGIILGEGEQTFLELMEYYGKKSIRLEDIKGITYKVDDNIVANPVRDNIDIADIPFIYDNYDKLNEWQNRIIYYEASRGCPYGCAYCLSSVDKNLRFRPMDMVKEELRMFIRNNVRQVKFVDRTFNAHHERTEEMLEFIRDNDNGITNFHFEIAGDILSENELKILEKLRPGLVQLEIGVQSTNEKTLECVNRRTNMEVLKNNVRRLLINNNIHIHLDLIAGLPGEDMDSFINSFNEVYYMGGHELQLGFLKLLKGAPITEQASQYGIKASKYPPYEVLETDMLSHDEIMQLKAVEEMLEIYHNSLQYERSEKILLGFEKTPYSLYENLAAYYSARGYSLVQNSRAKKYEILAEYYKSRNYPGYEVFCENLTMDFYARENAKARPSFAPECKLKKREITELLEENKYDLQKCRVEMFDNLGTILFDYSQISPISGNCCLINAPEGSIIKQI